jgi:hypothetical protein
MVSLALLLLGPTDSSIVRVGKPAVSPALDINAMALDCFMLVGMSGLLKSSCPSQ